MLVNRNLPQIVAIAVLVATEISSATSMTIDRADHLSDATINAINNVGPLRAIFYPVYKRTTTEERTAPLFQYLSAARKPLIQPEANNLEVNKLNDNRSARHKRSLYGLDIGYGIPYSNYPYSSGNAYLGTGYGGYGYGYGYGGFGGGYLDPYCDLLG